MELITDEITKIRPGDRVASLAQARDGMICNGLTATSSGMMRADRTYTHIYIYSIYIYILYSQHTLCMCVCL
jgi:hypothetical protein